MDVMEAPVSRLMTAGTVAPTTRQYVTPRAAIEDYVEGHLTEDALIGLLTNWRYAEEGDPQDPAGISSEPHVTPEGSAKEIAFARFNGQISSGLYTRIRESIRERRAS